MPGLLGTTNKTLIDVDKVIEEMVYYPEQLKANNYSDQNIIASQVYWFEQEIRENYFSDENTICWVDGDIYNKKFFEKKYFSKVINIAHLFIQILKSDNYKNLLAEINGEFTAVLHNKLTSEVVFVTDRLGTKPLYINRDFQNGLIWSSELKCFNFSKLNLTLNSEAVNSFLSLGHLMGDITWFNEVKFQSSATISRFYLSQKKCIEEYYWTWNNIREKTISFEDAVLETGKLFQNSINIRSSSENKFSIALSGGLDSRAILAGVPKDSLGNAFTFGSQKSIDVKVAKKVARIDNVPHIHFCLNEDNWLKGRFEAIWRTDCSVNLLDLHQSPFMNNIQTFNTINLDGFAGDLICGGSWMSTDTQCINQKLAESKFGSFSKFDSYRSVFYNANYPDSYFINTRVRRFTNLGTNEAVRIMKERKVFVDNDLVEFIYSIPNEYRLNNSLYKQVLLSCYSKYFEHIEWEKTGLPISKDVNLKYRIVSKLNKIIFGESYKQLANYNKWLKKKTFTQLVNRMINKNSLVWEFLNETQHYHYNEETQNFNLDNLKLISLEIWLNCINIGYTKTKEKYYEGF